MPILKTSDQLSAGDATLTRAISSGGEVSLKNGVMRGVDLTLPRGLST